ncbi:hypothetical protein D3874_03210 [Oleomonas cavernae]|uniref:Uncharacterized protein n=2 Tax=Oleomonas cavernae TaxID=2320859 RepID=A0A418WUL7_9PROT|nr:hypothetical protein D3874_03210 [Oleomonas cavernae]
MALKRVNLRGRKSPAALAANDRRPPREIIWAKIRQLQTFTIDQVATPARVDRSSARTFVFGLEKAGYLVRLDPNPDTKELRFQLAKDAGAAVPRIGKDGERVTQGDLRAAAWRAMRSLKVFTIRDLHVTSGISETDAKSYINYLVKAGFLAYRLKSKHAGQVSRLAFIESRFTGPKAPQVTSIKVVFDPNVGEVVWPIVGQDAIEVAP